MATYRLSVSTVSRSTGRSAVAAAAYRAAERLRNEHLRNEQDRAEHDYRNRRAHIAHTAIFAPSDAPEWAHDRAKLWNAAEARETRKNSVTARELQLSLPHELTDEQRQHLAEGYARELVSRYGVAVDLAIHRPDSKGDERNHHAHLLMTTRRMTTDGLGEKTRELDDRKTKEVERMRASWQEHVNASLELANVRERVDHRSYERQGVERSAEPRLGPHAHAMEQEGKQTLKAAWRDALRSNDHDAADRAAQAYSERQRKKHRDWYPKPPQPVLRPAGVPHLSSRPGHRPADRLADHERTHPAARQPAGPQVAPRRAFKPLAEERQPHDQVAPTRPVIQQPDVFARDPSKDVWAKHYAQERADLQRQAQTHALEQRQLQERQLREARDAATTKPDRRGAVAKFFDKATGEEEQRKRREVKERAAAERKRIADLEALTKRQQAEREQLKAAQVLERQRIARQVATTRTQETQMVQTFQRQAEPKREPERQRTQARGRSLSRERRERRGKKPQDAEP